MKKVVRMVHGYGANVPGEICGFPEKVAAKLVDKGIAVYVTATKAEVKKPAEAAVVKAPEAKEEPPAVVVPPAPPAEEKAPEVKEEKRQGGLFGGGKKKG